MKIFTSKRLISSLISLILFSNLWPVHTILQNVTLQHNKKPSVIQSAEQWKEQLALQPNFQQWKESTLTVSPLGPGTHGWLVLVHHEDQVIGYMMIFANEQDEHILSEYGIGEPSALQLHTQKRGEWTYLDYFHQVIAITREQQRVYIEPFMGEELPINKSLVNKVTKAIIPTKKEYSLITKPTLITGSDNIPYFSPYERFAWLTTASLNDKLDEDVSIEVLLEFESQLQFTTESWNETVHAVYSVTGFHEWNDYELYIALDDEYEEVTRYIPYTALMDLGNFYQCLDD